MRQKIKGLTFVEEPYFNGKKIVQELSNYEIEDCVFIGCDFSDVHFYGTKFIRCKFIRCMGFSKLTKNSFWDCYFEGNYKGLNFTGSEFKGILKNVRFMDAYIKDSEFFGGVEGTNMRWAKRVQRSLYYRRPKNFSILKKFRDDMRGECGGNIRI